ncbi:hypothetical protein SCHPADRAFT_233778 [Schizopora paradoxa]|uniref:Mid2 domain-containing protein n=1 Tax=Schizopora paradoxa TaxID=27342 RepID=A0A0H2RVK4_9AGAM|nr:hypothetical protein SCHPADRAFT_233778 [Schizopora paradoxa]
MVEKTQFNSVLSLFIVASIFALQVAAQTTTDSEDLTSDGLRLTSTRSSRRRRLAGGAIAGIVIGCLIFLALIAICCFCVLRMLTRRRRARAGPAGGMAPPMARAPV